MPRFALIRGIQRHAPITTLSPAISASLSEVATIKNMYHAAVERNIVSKLPPTQDGDYQSNFGEGIEHLLLLSPLRNEVPALHATKSG